MPYVTLFSEVTCAPQSAPDVAHALRQFVADTRAEPGCVQFELAQHPKEPHRFALFEVFRDQQAFETHAAAPHIPRIMGVLKANGGAATYDFWNLQGELSPRP